MAANVATDGGEIASPKGRRIPIPVLILAFLAIGYGSYRWYLARQPYEWSGTVEARVAYLGSRVGGRVKEVKVREGDAVKAGDVLLTLEPGDLNAQRLGAVGALEQARANLEKLEAGARPEELAEARANAATASAALQEAKAGARAEQIIAGRARLAQTQVSVDKAKLDATRAHDLLAKQAVSQAEADNADAALNSAIAARDAAKATLDELEHGTRQEDIAQAAARAQQAQASAKLVQEGARVEDLRAAKGAVDAAQGRLDQIDANLGELEVKAPMAGRIEALDLRPGTILAPAATAVTLVEKDQLYVRIYIPETQIGRVHVGEDVPITVDSFPKRAFKGKVEHINSVGEYTPRNLQTADERADQVFATRVGIVDGEADLRAGMAAFIRVPKQ
ncbi:MAG TPA: efflux RND transporter periplasmic adaptor subunit [Polyangiaceae bacterium]|jgi:multidrug resistance efflux pump